MNVLAETTAKQRASHGFVAVTLGAETVTSYGLGLGGKLQRIERKRIAREIHDTWDTRAIRTSAGSEMPLGLDYYRSHRAKGAVSVSEVVREGSRMRSGLFPQSPPSRYP